MLARKRVITASASSSARLRSRRACSAWREAVTSSTVSRPLPSGSGTPVKSSVRPLASSMRPSLFLRSSVAARMTWLIRDTALGSARFGAIAPSKSSACGWPSRTSCSIPQAPGKPRFHNSRCPSGANTASASNRLSNVAVRVRSSVSRVADSASCSVRSSAIITSPPSGSGCATIRRCVLSESDQASSCGSSRWNHSASSLRQAGKSRTSGMRPFSRAISSICWKVVRSLTTPGGSEKTRWNGWLAKVMRCAASNCATPIESWSSIERCASRKARNSRACSSISSISTA